MRLHRSPSFGARFLRRKSLGLTCAILGTSLPVPAYADLNSDLASARAQLEQIGVEYAAINSEIAALGDDLQKTVRD